MDQVEIPQETRLCSAEVDPLAGSGARARTVSTIASAPEMFISMGRGLSFGRVGSGQMQHPHDIGSGADPFLTMPTSEHQRARVRIMTLLRAFAVGRYSTHPPTNSHVKVLSDSAASLLRDT